MSDIVTTHKKVEYAKKVIQYVVACYVRVSTDEQVKFGFSIQAQKEALEKYCKEHGYKCEFFIDEGISASTMKRPALQKMLNKIQAFDMVLFTKLDRLSRNVLDANNINKILQNNNCTMKAIDEDDIDTSTADGTFIFNLKVSLAQREIGKTSERIKFVFQNKRNNGEVTSGTVKYGYAIKDKKFIINEDEANNIVELYKYFINVNGDISKTYTYFVSHFPSKGYDAMKGYLRDTAYIGKYKLYRKNVYLENYIPRIMDDNLFYTAQNLLKKKQKHVAKNNITSLFSGLVYCQCCGNRMTKKQDNRVKNRLIRYSCDNVFRYKIGSKDKKCTNHTLIREDKLETYLFENLKNELERFKLKSQHHEEISIKVDPNKIKRLENKIIKLKDLYLDDLIDKDSYTKDYKKYTLELNNLKNNIKPDEVKDFSKIEKIINSDYVTIYSKLSIENKRKFWLSFIDKIYVADGNIKEVTFL